MSLKGLKQKSVKRNPPREFEDVWDELQATISVENDNNLNKILADMALENLESPLTNRYTTEAEFDTALFDALRDSFDEYQLEEQNDENILLLKIGKGEDYAVGIARQKPVALNLDPSEDESFSSTEGFTSYRMTSQSTPDHVACLFQKLNNQWDVLDCFSVVELKLSDTTCGNFDVTNDVIGDANLFRNHSALGQTILYNFDCVLLHHARRGVSLGHLPLAILAGKKKTLSESDRDQGLKPNRKAKLLAGKMERKNLTGPKGKAQEVRNPKKMNKKPEKRVDVRWVSGRVEVPSACGNAFSYSVQDFGLFCDDGVDEILSVRKAASLYLETLLFGLKVALSVQSNFANDGPLRPAVPASGKSLMIGDAKLELAFCVSPIRGANVVWHDSESEGWKSSQGEVFKGRLNLGDFLDPKKPAPSFLFFSDDEINMEEDVVVKVSSMAVHNLLILPERAGNVLYRIQLSRDDDLLKEIRSVVKAVVETDVGLITIMKDLSKQGYKMLKPINYPGKLSVLWSGFQKLVQGVLIPLAAIGIIHPDIRPGYDVTSNILYKLEENESMNESSTMKLIDYESLVRFAVWTAPSNDGRYINSESLDAVAFVWWQCMGVAYMWKEKITADEFRQGRGMADLRSFLLDGGGPEWLEKFKDIASGKMDASHVTATLHLLANEFV